MASKNKRTECSVENSYELLKICEVFFSEGLLSSYKKKNNKIVLSLKYHGHRCVIKDIRPVSLRGSKVTLDRIKLRKERCKYLVRTNRGIMMSTTNYNKLIGGEVLMEILY